MIPRTRPERSGRWNLWRAKCALALFGINLCPLAGVFEGGEGWLACRRCLERRRRVG
jgi:hypothetical protein